MEERRFSDRIQHEIEAHADLREILGGVVDCAIRAEGFNEVQMLLRDD